jgi:hypothetical protein
MKKVLVIITVFIMIFTFGGCKQQQNNPPQPAPQTPAPQTPAPQTPATPSQDTNKPAIGNIGLGDSRDKVIETFGKDYKETFEQDPLNLGEPFYKWVYDRGIRLIIGKNTNQVLEIETTDPTLATNLGVKVGDTYETVNSKYGSYKLFKSNQDNSDLAGWYELGNGQVIIFDFNRGDNAVVNKDIKPDSKVELIRITYSKFID